MFQLQHFIGTIRRGASSVKVLMGHLTVRPRHQVFCCVSGFRVVNALPSSKAAGRILLLCVLSSPVLVQPVAVRQKYIDEEVKFYMSTTQVATLYQCKAAV